MLVLAAFMRVRRLRGWVEAGRIRAGVAVLLRPAFLPPCGLLGADGWLTDEEEDDKEDKEEAEAREVEDLERLVFVMEV